jgi:anti-sigma factor RsiW
MINQESQLKLQAYLDGELPGPEAAEVTTWLAHDAAAQGLLQELQQTCGALAGFEADCKLPESREFFWSKIEREIERQSRAEKTSATPAWFSWVQRHIIPVSGAALVSCLLAVLVLQSGKPAPQFGELELASDKMGAYTFRDHEAQLTMVWLYNHDDDSSFTQSDTAANVAPE